MEASCFSEQTALDFVAGHLVGSEGAALLEHAAECEPCRRLLSELGRFSDKTLNLRKTLGLETPLERGSPVGRYVVVDRIGAGAMGVVYGAYDPELDRKIAIKLVRMDRGKAQGSDGIRRQARRVKSDKWIF